MLKTMTGLAMAATLSVANAQALPFDPASLKGPAKGTPNEVMVLGTVHLRYLPPPFQPDSLKTLNERLLAWKPAVIAIEERSGLQCHFLRQYPQRYKGTVQSFCAGDTAPARASTGLDVVAATAEADRLLAAWPASPTPGQRRHLAAVFLAGGEPVSALVQWLRLPQAERRTGDGLDSGLVAELEKQRERRNESTLVAAPLAAALGLERVHTMDDHTSDPLIADEAGFEAAIRKAWTNPASAQRRQMETDVQPTLGNTEGVMALYRAINDPAQARLIHASDFGAALEDESPQQFGRGYVAAWEVRNLRMASNIREAIAGRPGSRTLVIVGASHKWYLEAYLNQMHDVRIVATDQVLR